MSQKPQISLTISNFSNRSLLPLRAQAHAVTLFPAGRETGRDGLLPKSL